MWFILAEWLLSDTVYDLGGVIIVLWPLEVIFKMFILL